MTKSEITYWQLIWYFSLEASAQAALVGSTDEQWFIEENEENRGANYLIGLCLLFIESTRPFNAEADRLRAIVLAVSERLEPNYWRFESLSATEEWTEARRIATRLLTSETPRVTPPRKPFHIEDHIHVDHYRHASKVREQLKKKRPGRTSHYCATPG